MESQTATGVSRFIIRRLQLAARMQGPGIEREPFSRIPLSRENQLSSSPHCCRHAQVDCASRPKTVLAAEADRVANCRCIFKTAANSL